MTLKTRVRGIFGKKQLETPVAEVDYHVFRQTIFKHALRFMEGILGKTGSLIDLGAGHCQYSLMADAMGWKTTALDARQARRPTDLPDRIPYLSGDVLSDVWRPEDYDVILCLGLYYHLDQDQQHALLKKIKGIPLILDTHFVTKYKSPHSVSAIYQKNGEIGADYDEVGHLNDEARKSTSLLASYENRTSWWQTQESLRQTLYTHGWPQIWTLNYRGEDAMQRTFFVCLPANDDPASAPG